METSDTITNPNAQGRTVSDLQERETAVDGTSSGSPSPDQQTSGENLNITSGPNPAHLMARMPAGTEEREHEYEDDTETDSRKRQHQASAKGARKSSRPQKERALLDPSKYNADGLYQKSKDLAIIRDPRAEACWWWDNDLEGLGWWRVAGKNDDFCFFPPPLKVERIDARDIKKHGTNGIHFADGWETLHDMVCTHGQVADLQPGNRFRSLDSFCYDYLEHHIPELKEKARQFYTGDPSDIKLHPVVMNLGVVKLCNDNNYTFTFQDGRHKKDKKYSSDDLLAYFVKYGIPDKHQLSKEKLTKLEERVKFAHVDLNNLKSANQNLLDYSNEILHNEEIIVLLNDAGFQRDPDNQNRFFQPEGKQFGNPSMKLSELRVFIRATGTWSADGRSPNRIDKRKTLALRLWGATSKLKLPIHENIDWPATAPTTVPPVASSATSGGAAAVSRDETLAAASEGQESIIAIGATPSTNLAVAVEARRVSLDPPKILSFSKKCKFVHEAYHVMSEGWRNKVLSEMISWKTEPLQALESLPKMQSSDSLRLGLVEDIYLSLDPDDRQLLSNEVVVWERKINEKNERAT